MGRKHENLDLNMYFLFALNQDNSQQELRQDLKKKAEQALGRKVSEKELKLGKFLTLEEVKKKYSNKG